MIDSIVATSGMQKPPQKSEALSDEQLATISETLSGYDPENLTSEDAASIVEIFKSENIPPGKALEAAMADFGFDAKAVGELAGLPQRSPKPENSNQMSDMLSFLKDTISTQLEQSGNETLSEEDIKAVYQTVYQKFGIDEDASLIDTTA